MKLRCGRRRHPPLPSMVCMLVQTLSSTLGEEEALGSGIEWIASRVLEMADERAQALRVVCLLSSPRSASDGALLPPSAARGFGTWLCATVTRIAGPARQVVEAACENGELLSLNVTPPERTHDIVHAGKLAPTLCAHHDRK